MGRHRRIVLAANPADKPAEPNLPPTQKKTIRAPAPSVRIV
jgi:hypothetical protein